DQDPALAEQAHGRAVDVAIGARPARQLATRLDERRWVEDDHAEAIPGALQLARDVEAVPLPKLDSLGEAIALGITPCDLQRGCGGVDREHFRGAPAGGVQRPLALIAEEVQHALVPGARFGAPSVLALIEE